MDAGFDAIEVPSNKKRKSMSKYRFKGVHINKKESRNRRIILNVGIHYGCEIDRDQVIDPRLYFVYGWLTEDETFRTHYDNSIPNPKWGKLYRLTYIDSGNFEPDMPLHLEVYRLGTTVNPGTSARRAMVGRGRVKLPKTFDTKEVTRCGLVTPEGKPAGFVWVELLKERY